MFKQFKGYRTLIIAAAISIGGLLQLEIDWLSVLGPTWSGLFVMVLGAVMAWLRTLTSTPVLEKPKDV